jgi:hypothetical protein
MLLCYPLMLASIDVLVLLVHHAGQGLRGGGLIDLVGARSREFIVRAALARDRRNRVGRRRHSCGTTVVASRVVLSRNRVERRGHSPLAMRSAEAHGRHGIHPTRR